MDDQKTGRMSHTYTISPLEPMGHTVFDESNTALSINTYGHVVGWSQTPMNTGVFRYDGRQTQYLGTFGGSTARAYDINTAGQIVGEIILSADSTGHIAFRFDGSTLATFDPLQRRNSYASAINAQGQIVIQCGGFHAFRVTGEHMQPLGASANYRIQAHAINTAGQVVGWSARAGQGTSSGFAFITDGQDIHQVGALDFGTGTQQGSSAWGINDHGHIVGLAGQRRGPRHAFLYDGQDMHDLGTLNNWFSIALSINNHADIVGYAWYRIRDSVDARALLWRKRRLIDLTAVIGDPQWVLRKAVAINDAGQIVGWGTFQGQMRMFLLTPH
jgi:probable HAF family extracellular repeat protein